MSSLIVMFGDIDDFCKSFEPLYLPQRLRDEQDHMIRYRQMQACAPDDS
jgi:hypothetical protein